MSNMTDVLGKTYNGKSRLVLMWIKPNTEGHTVFM
jgi:hypothetical protein